MPYWVIASVFGILALAAMWGIYSSLVTGVTIGETSTYNVDDNPIGFVAVVMGKFFVLCFSVAMALHALGFLAADPMEWLQRMFPFLPKTPRY